MRPCNRDFKIRYRIRHEMMFLIQLFRTLIMVQVLECLLAVLYVCIPVANVNHNQEYQTYLTARDGDYFSHSNETSFFSRSCVG